MNRLFLFIISIFSVFFVFAQRSQDEQLAVQFYQQGEYEKAKAIFKTIFDKKPDSYIYTYYYPLLLQLEDYKELEKVVKAQQKAFPTLRRYDIDLGYVYERQGDINKALKEYDAAIKNVPVQEASYRDLHYAFLGKAKRDYAIDVLLKGRKVLQNPKLFTKELVYVYTLLKNTEKIIEEALNYVKDGDNKQLAEAQTILQNLIMEDDDNTNYLVQVWRLDQNGTLVPTHTEYDNDEDCGNSSHKTRNGTNGTPPGRFFGHAHVHLEFPATKVTYDVYGNPVYHKDYVTAAKVQAYWDHYYFSKGSSPVSD